MPVIPNTETADEIDEIWSVSADRIEAYFLRADRKSCAVTVEALEPRRMGSLTFPRSRLRIRGENAGSVYREFVIAFMSAGG